jgi:chaperone required for assembly of F1-ATPase
MPNLEYRKIPLAVVDALIHQADNPATVTDAERHLLSEYEPDLAALDRLAAELEEQSL